jgi:nicotinamidase-related amidase
VALTTLDPKTALVVIDLQNAVVALPGTPLTTAQVVARSVELADAFRAKQLPVVLVRVDTTPADSLPGRTERVRPTGGTPPEGAAQIVDALAGHPEDIVVVKRNWGAFYGTDLDLHLRRRGITQVVFTGVATSIGVESSARAAYEHGYHVTLATDAMTDLNPDAHRNSLDWIFPRLGESGTTAEVLELLAKTHA